MADRPISPLQRLVLRYEEKTQLVFKPSRGFYEAMKINHLRFSLLLQGKKQPDAAEIRTLLTYFSQFFPVNAEDLL
jgi:hypothetical protein